MENNYINYFSNEDILHSSRDPKSSNLYSMKYKKVMAIKHKKPILYKKMDYTNIKELLKSKHNQSNIRNVFNSFFRNSESQEAHQQSKALPLQNSTNQLSINININNINIQNYNVSTKSKKNSSGIKFPLVLKHNIMTPSIQKTSNTSTKLHLDKRSLSKGKVNGKRSSPLLANVFKRKDNNEGPILHLPKKGKVADDTNDDSVIDELVDLLERREGTNQTMKKEDVPLNSIRTLYPKMVNQNRPQTSYGGLQLRQRQLQKSASCRLSNKCKEDNKVL